MTNFLSALLIFALSFSAHAKDPAAICKAALSAPMIFDLETGKATLVKSRLVSHLGRQLLGLSTLEDAAAEYLKDPSDHPYYVRLAAALRLSISYNPSAMELIPKEGEPAVVVTNHKSSVDGIALGAMLSLKRNDVKVVLNAALAGVPGMPDNAIFIDMGNRRKRALAILEMTRHLERGGALIIFPSGEIMEKVANEFVDPEWKPGILMALEKAKNFKDVKILPAFMEGDPHGAYPLVRKVWDFKLLSGVAQTATGLIHIKDIASRTGSTIDFTIGAPISTKILDHSRALYSEEDAKRKAAQYLRFRSGFLKKDPVETTLKPVIPPKPQIVIADEMPASIVREELKSEMILDDSHAENPDKGIQVYFAKGNQIPNVMREIGRLREIAFRDVGEGSGLARDNDRFDEDYHHLIAFDKKTKRIIGSYRVGLLKDIIEAKGLDGVYSTGFFKMSPVFIERMKKSIELGRSFVVKEFRRQTLPALFRGIAKVYMKYPEYEYLMGTVSISNAYNDESKLAMLKFLNQHHRYADPLHAEQLAFGKKIIELKTKITDEQMALAFRMHGVTKPSSFKELDELVQTFEGPKVHIPPLLKIYSDFGVQFIDFSFDPDFNTVDGLIFTHLASQPFEVLKPYFGEEAALSLQSRVQRPPQ